MWGKSTYNFFFCYLLYGFIFLSEGFAQVQISQQVIGSTGNFSSAGGITLSSTTGEPAVKTLKNGELVLTEGFQQPAWYELEDIDLRIYTGITPNNDGNNDLWEMDGIEQYPDNQVVIYNRWGDKVWEAKRYDNQNVVWNGTSMKGHNLPDGTYFFVLDITGLQTYKGWVQLTR